MYEDDFSEGGFSEEDFDEILSEEEDDGEDEDDEGVDDQNTSLPRMFFPHVVTKDTDTAQNKIVISDDEDDEDDEDHVDIDGCEEGRTPDDLQSQIWHAINKLRTPSTFAMSDHRSASPNPGLHIHEIGMIGLPLSSRDASAIISKCKPATFDNTEVDMVDHHVWELDAGQVSFENPEWHNEVQSFMQSAYTEFALICNVKNITFELDKLVVYGVGAHHEPLQQFHQGRGSFGTLVVSLPSAHEGGKLIFKHGGETHEFDAQEQSTFRTSFAAWYTSVYYDMSKLVSGYRLELRYRLLHDEHCSPLRAPTPTPYKETLVKLLQTYDSQLNSKGSQLPPFLIHKLSRRYDQPKILRSLLDRDDASQLYALKQVDNIQNFRIYLATWELTSERLGEEAWSFNEEQNRTEHLLNVVDLDGTLIAKTMEVPEDAILDPRKLDGDEDAEVEVSNEYRYTTTTYTFEKTVVILVPPSRQIDFSCCNGEDIATTLSVLRQLKAELSHDPTRKPALQRTCQMVIKAFSRYDRLPLKRELFDEAATTALQMDDENSFLLACTRTSGEVAHANAQEVGRSFARLGKDRIDPLLRRALDSCVDFAKRRTFLRSAEKGFEEQPSAIGRETLETFKRHCDNLLLESVLGSRDLERKDGPLLVELSKEIAWALFDLKVLSKISLAQFPVRISLINQLAASYRTPTHEQRSSLAVLIKQTWQSFTFNSDWTPKNGMHYAYNRFQTTVQHGYRYREDSGIDTTRILAGEELAAFVETSNTILPSFDTETGIIPRLLSAISEAKPPPAEYTFISFLRHILEGGCRAFQFPTPKSLAPPSHKVLVQSMIESYVKHHVGEQPELPTNWKMSSKNSCKCNYCLNINAFIRNKDQEWYEFRGLQTQRKHIEKQCRSSSWSFETIKCTPPHILRITKNRTEYEHELDQYTIRQAKGKEKLRQLVKTKEMHTRMSAYLIPSYDEYMSAKLEELPSIDVDLPTLDVTDIDASVDSSVVEHVPAANTRSAQKRKLSDVSDTDGVSNKRARWDMDKENVPTGEDEVVIFDLTEE